MHSPSSCSDRGTVTAELAVGIPSVLGIAGVLLSLLRWGMDGVTATTIASESAYAIARGEPSASALERARQALPAADWAVESRAASTCVTALVAPPVPLVPGRTVVQCVTN